MKRRKHFTAMGVHPGGDPPRRAGRRFRDGQGERFQRGHADDRNVQHGGESLHGRKSDPKSRECSRPDGDGEELHIRCCDAGAAERRVELPGQPLAMGVSGIALDDREHGFAVQHCGAAARGRRVERQSEHG